MKKIIFISAIMFAFLLSANSVFSQKSQKQTLTLKPGTYLMNTTDLYFFDDGINCYLMKKCRDVDTVFENKAKKLIITKDSVIKYQAYLFTDTYEYVYTKIGDNDCWIRAEIPITNEQKVFFKRLLLSPNYEPYSAYVEAIPFKDPYDVFISTTDDWYISNLNTLNYEKIGTKGGRLEDCTMYYPKNCVKCYIDLGWGQEVWYDSKGKKIK
jgi:hypothetical protein